MSDESPSCPGCGFVWDGVTLAQSVSGVNDSVAPFVSVLEGAGEMATVRPRPDRWSIVEYAGHLRDVLLSLRERTILASVVDNPTGSPIYRDERVNLGFYSLDSVDDAADELAFASGLLSKTIAALPEGFGTRRLTYSPVFGGEVTIEWVAAQAFHEASHHLLDVQDNARMLA